MSESAFEVLILPICRAVALGTAAGILAIDLMNVVEAAIAPLREPPRPSRGRDERGGPAPPNSAE